MDWYSWVCGKQFWDTDPVRHVTMRVDSYCSHVYRLAVLNDPSIYDRLTRLLCHLKPDSICTDFPQWVLELSGNVIWLINILMTHLVQRIKLLAPLAWNSLCNMTPPPPTLKFHLLFLCSSVPVFTTWFLVFFLQHTKHSPTKGLCPCPFRFEDLSYRYGHS